MRHRTIFQSRMCVLIHLGLLAIIVLSGCGAPQCSVPAPSLTDAVPRLLVMSAFAPEIRKLVDAATVDRKYVINGRTYVTGMLSGNNVVLVQSGVSMVNATMTTQTALDYFHIEGILMSGVAGGVNPNLNIGDVVIPAQWGQYQEHVFARETSSGWDIGWHSQAFGNFGMMFPQPVMVTRRNERPDQEEQAFWFAVDPTMLAVARQTIDSVTLRKCTSYRLCLPYTPTIHVGGNGVSGSTYVENAEYRDWVWQTFKADALDMESAAVAHVAYANGIPYLIFRSVSDLAGGDESIGKTLAFFQLAADNSATVVIKFLEAWSKQGKLSEGIMNEITFPNMSLRGVLDEAISWTSKGLRGRLVRHQSLAMTGSGK